jgi:hypothetical protein
MYKIIEINCLCNSPHRQIARIQAIGMQSIISSYQFSTWRLAPFYLPPKWQSQRKPIKNKKIVIFKKGESRGIITLSGESIFFFK